MSSRGIGGQKKRMWVKKGSGSTQKKYLQQRCGSFGKKGRYLGDVVRRVGKEEGHGTETTDGGTPLWHHRIRRKGSTKKKNDVPGGVWGKTP